MKRAKSTSVSNRRKRNSPWPFLSSSSSSFSFINLSCPNSRRPVSWGILFTFVWLCSIYKYQKFNNNKYNLKITEFHDLSETVRNQSYYKIQDTKNDSFLKNSTSLWLPSANSRMKYWKPPSKQNNGYLVVRCNGGLNQQRSAICNAVVVARVLNATLVLPRLDANTFWNDHSEFSEIYDVVNFVKSLKNDVIIVNSLPKGIVLSKNKHQIRPPREASLHWYQTIALTKLKRRGVIYLTPFAHRLAENLRADHAYHVRHDHNDQHDQTYDGDVDGDIAGAKFKVNVGQTKVNERNGMDRIGDGLNMKGQTRIKYGLQGSSGDGKGIKYVRKESTEGQRLVNDGEYESTEDFAEEMQRLRCRANFRALKFLPNIEKMAAVIVSRLRMKSIKMENKEKKDMTVVNNKDGNNSNDNNDNNNSNNNNENVKNGRNRNENEKDDGIDLNDKKNANDVDDDVVIIKDDDGYDDDIKMNGKTEKDEDEDDDIKMNGKTEKDEDEDEDEDIKMNGNKKDKDDDIKMNGNKKEKDDKKGGEKDIVRKRKGEYYNKDAEVVQKEWRLNASNERKKYYNKDSNDNKNDNSNMKKHSFIAVHLRFELDMLAFAGCVDVFSEEEQKLLIEYRKKNFAKKNWKAEERRRMGKCPLMPEEVGLILRANGYDSNTHVYVASGKVFGGKKYMRPLKKLFPNLESHDTVVSKKELEEVMGGEGEGEGKGLVGSAMDYIVCLHADVFLPSYDGPSNFANNVLGHRLFLKSGKNLSPDRKLLAPLFQSLRFGNITHEQFYSLARPIVNADTSFQSPNLHRSKSQNYFFANPWPECFCRVDLESTSESVSESQRSNRGRGQSKCPNCAESVDSSGKFRESLNLGEKKEYDVKANSDVCLLHNF